MAVVTIKMNSKPFQVGCEDNQQQLLVAAAEMLNQRLIDLKRISPLATTEYLLLLCALSMQNELSLLKNNQTTPYIEKDRSSDEMLEALNQITEYIERIATKLKK